jgi:hypothetical protein
MYAKLGISHGSSLVRKKAPIYLSYRISTAIEIEITEKINI